MTKLPRQVLKGMLSFGLIFSCNHLMAQTVIFADSVINYSSQFSATNWSSNQILGMPNVYPIFDDHINAWASDSQDGQREYIEVHFSPAMQVDSIWVFETYGSGSIDTVYVKNDLGQWVNVYTATATPTNTAQILKVGFPMTTFDVSEVRLALNSPDIPGWNQLDAVAIVSSVGPNQADVELTNLDMNQYVLSGPLEVKGRITNIGFTDVSSVDIKWTTGSGANSVNFPVNLTYLQYYDFVHPIPINTALGTDYSLDVWIEVNGDSNQLNDTVSTDFSTLHYEPQRYVLVEDLVGTWCPWSPISYIWVQNLVDSIPFAIPSVCHNGDPMTLSSYEVGSFVGGFPGSSVDRIVPCHPTELIEKTNQRLLDLPPAEISVEVVQNGSEIDVTVTAHMATTLTGNYSLAAIVTEDSLFGTSSSWSQNNGYNGSSLIGAGVNWGSAGDPVPASMMVYNYVARRLGYGMNGFPNSMPGTIFPGMTTSSYTYTFDVGTMNLNHCNFIGMIINQDTDEILNAGATKTYTGNVGFDDFSNDLKLETFPNPSNGSSSLFVTLQKDANITIKVMNMIGEIIHEVPYANQTAGSHFYNIDLSDHESGTYIVQVNDGTSSGSSRLMLIK